MRHYSRYISDSPQFLKLQSWTGLKGISYWILWILWLALKWLGVACTGNDARDRDTLHIRNLSMYTDNPSVSEESLDECHVPLERIKLVCTDDQLILLGRGGFGFVYRAIVRQEEAAVKLVTGASEQEKARFLHEIMMLERCRSTHIVQFLGYSVADSRLLLCMELMKGGSLWNALRQNDELQWYNRWAYTASCLY